MEPVVAVAVIPIPTREEAVMVALRAVVAGEELIRTATEEMVREVKFASGRGRYG
jgi:tRNA(Ile2) C34 agmatinyltransferase TiaS